MRTLALLIILLLFSVFTFAYRASANQVQLSGKVRNQAGDPIPGATVEAIDPASNTTEASSTTDANGNYLLSLPASTYNVRVTPPAGSGFQVALITGQSLMIDTILDIVLVPATGQNFVTVSGTIKGASGSLIGPIGVSIGGASTTAGGQYSLQVQPGSYPVRLASDSEGSGFPDEPRFFDITSPSISFTQNMTLNFQLPSVAVPVHVQDADGNPIQNAGVGATLVSTGRPQTLSTSLGPLPFTLNQSFEVQSTDSAGDALLHLLPGDSPLTYDFTATAQTGAGLKPATLTNVSVDGSTSLTFVLTPIGGVRVSGTIKGASGSLIGPIGVSIGGASTTAGGQYSLQVQPGSYPVRLASDSEGSGFPDEPRFFDITSPSISFTRNTILDFQLPSIPVNVKVQDINGNPIINAGIRATLASVGSTQTVGTSLGPLLFTLNQSFEIQGTDSAGLATLHLLAGDAPLSYNFTAGPASGSDLNPVILNNVTATPGLSLTLTLTPNTNLVVSGQILKRDGGALPDQVISFNGPGGSSSQTPGGGYSLRVRPGNYTVSIVSFGEDTYPNAPRLFQVFGPTVSITQDQVIDFHVPSAPIMVHVQDAAGNPVPNAGVSASLSSPGVSQTFNSTLGPLAFSVSRCESFGGTDASGNAAIELLPGDSPARYNFSVSPPRSSLFAPFNVANVEVQANRTNVFVLEFVHPTPKTTASLVPGPDGAGDYLNPVTVTLSASAFNGFTIAATQFTVDGGSAQTYAGPFSIAGDGTHNLTYWSVDSAGVFEALNTLTLTIRSNRPPVASCKDITKPADANCQADVTAQEIDNGSSDPDGDSISLSLAPAGPYSHGQHVVTLTVTDARGAASTCAATITIIDTLAPAFSCPANITANNDPGVCSANVAIAAPTATDNCDGARAVTGVRSDDRALGDPYPVGATAITWTATDTSGNVATCRQMVTVRDTSPPRVTAPANATYQCINQVPPAKVADATATDNCQSPTVSVTEASNGGIGSAANPLILTRTYTAVDAAGNRASAIQMITVMDNIPPSITCPADFSVVAQLGQSAATVNYPPPAVTDNCASQAPICSPPPGASLQLGTTTVTCSARDGVGNTTTCAFHVSVINTPAGSNVVTRPVDSTTGGTPVTETFSNVTQPGISTLTTNSTGPQPPAGFQLGNPPTYYLLTTTATFTGSIQICVNYANVSFKNPRTLKLMHFDGRKWVDITTSRDTVNQVICGSVTSLSPFAVFVDAIDALQSEIEALDLSQGERNSLTAKLNAAQASINRGNSTAAANQLHAFINEVRALEQSHRIDSQTARTLSSEAEGIITGL